MAAPTRRDWLVYALSVAAIPTVGSVTRRVLAQADAPVQVVKIVAQRFRYTPAEFRVQAGRPVVLEFTALDFVHGFSLPDLHLRADLLPGQVTRVALPPAQQGVYDFLCDNFCGTAHEEMHGRMVVQA